MIKDYKLFLNENVYKDEFLRLYNLAPQGLKDIVEKTKEVQQSLDWHPEGVVWIHIRLVTNRLANTYHDMNLNLAGFFHDLGKNYVTEPNGRGGWSAHGHEERSILLVDEYKDWIIEQGGKHDIVSYIVINHMRYKYLDQMRIQEQMRFMEEVYFPYVQKFSTADYGGTELNCEPMDNHEYEKRKIAEYHKKEEENKIIAKRFNASMIMDKYPELRGEKLGNALALFKRKYEDFRQFVLDNSTEEILKAFDDYYVEEVTESVKDMLKPISEKDMKKTLASKSLKEKLWFAVKYNRDSLVKELFEEADDKYLQRYFNLTDNELGHFIFMALFMNTNVKENKLYQLLCSKFETSILDVESLVDEINKYKELIGDLPQMNKFVDTHVLRLYDEMKERRVSYCSDFYERAADDGYLVVNMNCHYVRFGDEYRYTNEYRFYHVTLDKSALTRSVTKLYDVVQLIRKVGL